MSDVTVKMKLSPTAAGRLFQKACRLEDESKALRQQLQQSEARVAELEEWAGRRPNVHDRDLRTEFAQWADEIGASNGAWLLRKQAEAVEAFGQSVMVETEENDDLTDGEFYADDIKLMAETHAQRLRQQADELEKGGESCTHS